SFPQACTVRFRFATSGDRPVLDLFWYDGSMRPPTPGELLDEDKELAPEGLMFVGDSGKILCGFRGENPRILPESRMRQYQDAADRSESSGRREDRRGDAAWLTAFKGGAPTYGDFLLAGPITDAFNLAAVSLRLGGTRLRFDA